LQLPQHAFELIQRHRANSLFRPPRARPVANSAAPAKTAK
jgi:hypothetical protein